MPRPAVDSIAAAESAAQQARRMAQLTDQVIDDQSAINAAKGRGVMTRRSLALICEGLRSQLISRAQACALVDELRSADARLPCDGATFEAWAVMNGLLL